MFENKSENRLSHPSIIFPKIPNHDYSTFCQRKTNKVCVLSSISSDNNVFVNLDNNGNIKVSSLQENFINNKVYPWNKVNRLFNRQSFY